MALTFLPTVAEIRDRSKLRPEQVDRLYGGAGATADQASTAFNTDIAERLVEQAAVAEGMLLSHFTAAQILLFDTEQETRGELAIKLLVVGDLYDSAGSLNEKYQQEATNYLERGRVLLQSLIDADSGADDGAFMVSITVGESFPDEDEDD